MLFKEIIAVYKDNDNHTKPIKQCAQLLSVEAGSFKGLMYYDILIIHLFHGLY
jgi:hypothetical protein